mgnify:CR=1 FL=1
MYPHVYCKAVPCYRKRNRGTGSAASAIFVCLDRTAALTAEADRAAMPISKSTMRSEHTASPSSEYGKPVAAATEAIAVVSSP